jgi:mRNA interferase HigB
MRISLYPFNIKTKEVRIYDAGREFADIKKTFNSVDSVGNQHYVFNIRGNNYRLVVVIQFTPQFVYVRFIGTHAEYDKIDCSTI